MSDEIVRHDGTVVPGYGGRSFFYDRQGQPITAEEADPLLGDITYKRVAGDTVVLDGQQLAVSTVWLAVDHNFSRQGPPLIFETMVFGDHPLAEDACWRYATEDEARTGHENVVKALRTARLTDEILADDAPKEITP